MELFAAYAPMIGLLFFFTVFVGIAIQAYRPSQKQHLQSFAFIPLKEESRHD